MTTRKSTGILTDSQVVDTGRGILNGIYIVTGGAGGGTVTVYDNPSAASGTELFTATLASGTSNLYFDLQAVRYKDGLYIDDSAADLQVIVYYGAGE